MKGGGPIGVRDTFADLAATVAANFGVRYDGHGRSFLDKLLA